MELLDHLDEGDGPALDAHTQRRARQARLAASSWHSPPMARWVSAIARGRNVCPVRTRRWLVKWSGDLSHPDRDGFSVLPRPGPQVGGVTRWAPNRWLAERDPA
jgi:hypothetical protein